MSFKIGSWKFIAKLSRPNTVWWHLIKTKKSPLQRVDSILALERVFIRKYRVYVWNFKIGRFQLLVANLSQKGNLNV